jgi:hypothetical protein
MFHVARQDIDPLGNEKTPGNGKETSSYLHQICSKMDVKYIKRLLTSAAFPFFKVIPWSSNEVCPLLPTPLKNLPFWPASKVALLPKMMITLPLCG